MLTVMEKGYLWHIILNLPGVIILMEIYYMQAMATCTAPVMMEDHLAVALSINLILHQVFIQMLFHLMLRMAIIQQAELLKVLMENYMALLLREALMIQV